MKNRNDIKESIKLTNDGQEFIKLYKKINKKIPLSYKDRKILSYYKIKETVNYDNTYNDFGLNILSLYIITLLSFITFNPDSIFYTNTFNQIMYIISITTITSIILSYYIRDFAIKNLIYTEDSCNKKGSLLKNNKALPLSFAVSFFLLLPYVYIIIITNKFYTMLYNNNNIIYSWRYNNNQLIQFIVLLYGLWLILKVLTKISSLGITYMTAALSSATILSEKHDYEDIFELVFKGSYLNDLNNEVMDLISLNIYRFLIRYILLLYSFITTSTIIIPIIIIFLLSLSIKASIYSLFYTQISVSFNVLYKHRNKVFNVDSVNIDIDKVLNGELIVPMDIYNYKDYDYINTLLEEKKQDIIKEYIDY